MMEYQSSNERIKNQQQNNLKYVKDKQTQNQKKGCAFEKKTRNHLRKDISKIEIENREQYMQNYHRILSTQQSQQLRITLDYTHLENNVNDNNYQTHVKEIMVLIVKYIQDVFSVYQETSNLSVADRIDGIYESYCESWLYQDGKFQIPQADKTNGIANSDLHIYITGEETDDSTKRVVGYPCQWKFDRPTIARLHFNKSKLGASTSNVGYDKNYQEILHQFLHVMGFNGDNVKNFRKFYQGPRLTTGEYNAIVQFNIPIGSSTFKVLKSTNILAYGKTYYNCASGNDLKGIPFENKDQTATKIGSHWEFLALKGEIMTNESEELQNLGNSKITKFTLNFFKDSNWYQDVNTNFSEELTWGKGRGCEFLTNSCNKDPDPFIEFTKVEDEKKCTFDNRYYGTAGSNTLSGSCLFIAPDSGKDCRDNANLNQNSVNTLERNSEKSACFISDIKTNAAPAIAEKHRCYEFKCNDAKTEITVSLWDGDQEKKITCSANGQSANAPAGYAGTLTCPANLLEFCTTGQACKNHCSGKGYCLNHNGVAKCHCIDGRAGEYCQHDCAGVIDVDGNTCIPSGICGVQKSPDVFNRQCYANTCHNDCTNQQQYCTGLLNTDCKKCPSGMYFYNNKCIFSCPFNKFQNEATKECENCHVNCPIKCVGTADSNCQGCGVNELFQNGICITSTTCANGYYSDANKICQKCHADCKALCTGGNAGDCTNCAGNLFYQGSVCIDKCYDGYYNNNSICQKCDPICPSLCGPTATDCQKCPNNQVFSENKCTDDCKYGYFSDENSVCKPCFNLCICEKRFDNCLSDGAVRLKNGIAQMLLNKQWTEVCDDDFDATDANVFCKQVGMNDLFTFSSAQNCPANPKFMISQLQCAGDEDRIYDCPKGAIKEYQCSAQECVSIQCTNLSGVRVDQSSKALQVNYDNSAWKNVCGDTFKYNEAFVACKQMGFKSFKSYKSNVACPQNAGTFWISGVSCTGKENNLADCNKSFTINAQTCNAASSCIELECSNDVNLSSGNVSSDLGLLMIYNDVKWGQICDDGFDSSDATVICKQLGKKDQQKKITYSSVECIDKNFLVANLQCAGSENKITECPNFAWVSKTNCGGKECISINCDSDDTTIKPDPNPGNTNTDQNNTKTEEKKKKESQKSGDFMIILIFMLAMMGCCCILCCVIKCCRNKRQNFDAVNKKKMEAEGVAAQIEAESQDQKDNPTAVENVKNPQQQQQQQLENGSQNEENRKESTSGSGEKQSNQQQQQGSDSPSNRSSENGQQKNHQRQGSKKHSTKKGTVFLQNSLEKIPEHEHDEITTEKFINNNFNQSNLKAENNNSRMEMTDFNSFQRKNSKNDHMEQSLDNMQDQQQQGFDKKIKKQAKNTKKEQQYLIDNEGEHENYIISANQSHAELKLNQTDHYNKRNELDVGSLRGIEDIELSINDEVNKKDNTKQTQRQISQQAIWSKSNIKCEE